MSRIRPHPHSAAPSVPRFGRLLDLAGILLIVAGGAIFAWSYLELRAMPGGRAAPGAAPGAVAAADRLSQLAQLGVALMIVGLVVAVAAAVWARRFRRLNSGRAA